MRKKSQIRENDHEYNQLITDMFELVNHPGWSEYRKIIREEISLRRTKLEKCTVEELPFLQAEIAAFKYAATIPQTILDEFQREKERDAARKGELTEVTG